MSGDADPPVLLRIPFSHYCRKAEWGLTQAGIAYQALDVSLPGMRHIGRANPEEQTVPVLFAGGTRVLGSGAILAWADDRRRADAAPLHPRDQPDVAAWEAWVDDELGPVARREAYRVAHAQPLRFQVNPVYRPLLLAGRRVTLGVLKFYKARRFDGHDKAFVPEAVARIAGQLASSGTGFLFGARPTAADLATAALFEPLTYAVGARDYAALPGWSACVEHLGRVRPERTTRLGRRRVRERDWAWMEEQAVARAPA